MSVRVVHDLGYPLDLHVWQCIVVCFKCICTIGLTVHDVDREFEKYDHIDDPNKFEKNRKERDKREPSCANMIEGIYNDETRE